MGRGMLIKILLGQITVVSYGVKSSMEAFYCLISVYSREILRYNDEFSSNTRSTTWYVDQAFCLDSMPTNSIVQ